MSIHSSDRIQARGLDFEDAGDDGLSHAPGKGGVGAAPGSRGGLGAKGEGGDAFSLAPARSLDPGFFAELDSPERSARPGFGMSGSGDAGASAGDGSFGAAWARAGGATPPEASAGLSGAALNAELSSDPVGASSHSGERASPLTAAMHGRNAQPARDLGSVGGSVGRGGGSGSSFGASISGVEEAERAMASVAKAAKEKLRALASQLKAAGSSGAGGAQGGQNSEKDQLMLEVQIAMAEWSQATQAQTNIRKKSEQPIDATVANFK